MNDREPENYQQALALAIAAARLAGAILREEFHRAGGPKGSHGHALADDLAGERICELLRSLGWGIRCEDPSVFEPRSSRHTWLIDPNDGTSAYLKGWRGSAVSIAALRDGVPILGVVYAFAFADSGEGDLIAWAEGCPLTRNGREVPRPNLADATLSQPGGLPRVVFVSQSADCNPEANADCVRPARYIALPSIAYRLARVAVGDGLAGVSLYGPCGWDYGAGHALLRASGGVLLDQKGQEVTYTVDGQSNTLDCFGGAPAVVAELCGRDWKTVVQAVPSPEPPFCLVWPARGQAVADPGVLSRAQGCLLGQLAGDSLGGLVEFRNGERIEEEYPHGVRDLVDGGTWGNLAGQPTDDSEMALLLARTLVHARQYDRGKVLDAYARYWPNAWDKGGTLNQALSAALKEKTTTDRLRAVEKYANPNRPSNGSLMRISPLGIFASSRPEQAAEWARQESRLTHPNPVCQESCAAFVTAIAHAVGRGSGAWVAYDAAVAEAGRPGGQEAVLRALKDAQHDPPRDYQTEMGWVLIALQNAFYQLLHAPSLEEGVVDTIRRGGDTDTTAAIAGALLGAVHGREAIPARWQSALLSCRPLRDSGTRHPMPQEYWPVDALLLAEALVLAGRE
jgi:ADP-ribosylglycohydrolase/fructose-1,6-bisphosphatase/inositol monophosphatase family enzyme